MEVSAYPDCYGQVLPKHKETRETQKFSEQQIMNLIINVETRNSLGKRAELKSHTSKNIETRSNYELVSKSFKTVR